MAKVNLYRNISITFIVFTAMMLAAVFLFFYSSATVIIVPASQDINLSFNAEVKANPTTMELNEKDVLKGSVEIKEVRVSSTFEALSTRTVTSQTLVGKVKMVNSSNRDQALVKTTQLQADNGVIVRTNESIVVPAGGNVMVDVFPKDPATFSDVDPGNLKIIKLAVALQEKIYGVAANKLSNSPREVKVIAESDLNRAKQELAKKAEAEIRKELNLSENDYLSVELKDFTIDKKVGDEAADFIGGGILLVKTLNVDKDQLAKLIERKANNLDLKEYIIGNVNLSQVKYAVIGSNATDTTDVKIDYVLRGYPSADNEVLNRKNFVGKSIEEIKAYAEQSGMIKNLEVHISPYWQKKTPQQVNRIKVIINQ